MSGARSLAPGWRPSTTSPSTCSSVTRRTGRRAPSPSTWRPTSRPAVATLTWSSAIRRPPGFAFLQAPLAGLPFRSALWLFSALSLGALAGFLALCWCAGRGVGEMPLLVMGILSFGLVHEVLIMGHPTMFFVLALGGGFLALRSRRPVLAGLALSLLALKPQWAVLPALFLLVRGEWRALATMAIASAALFFLPFLATGLGALKSYEIGRA